MTDPTAIDLSTPRRIHIVGLGGAGMSAIAEVLVQAGHIVTGSDLTDSEPLRRLAASGVETHVGHDPDHIGAAELVATSTAIPPTNPEVAAAHTAGVAVHRRAELLTALTRSFRTVSVAGTHGKTTTSAMLASALRGCDLDPSFIVGGDLLDLGTGAAVGRSDLLVVEADESDGTFVELESSAAIVTNIEPDHLEHYGGFGALVGAFERFGRHVLSHSQGAGLVVCADDPGSRALAGEVAPSARPDGPRVWSYGVAEADVAIVDIDTARPGIRFELVGLDAVGNAPERLPVRLRQPGLHNARNATAAITMAVALGGDARAATALADFGGVGRRYQDHGEAGGVRIVEDYAHLPTELSAALAAARTQHRGRVVAAFQPHRYSRTEQLWESFTDCFDDADVVLVADIYSSGEAPRPGITADLIAEQLVRVGGHPAVRRSGGLRTTLDALRRELRPGDLCILLGAGDINSLAPALAENGAAAP